MQVVIVGAGRLGRSLAMLWERAGHDVELCGRREPIRAVDVVVLAVPDGAVRPVAARVPETGVLLHCSGALTIAPLRPHRPSGSLHPLMTFPGPEVGLPELSGVPAAVAGDAEAVAVASQLAASLGMRAIEVPGDRRLYHAAAVMAGNFATVLLAEAARVLERAGVPADTAAATLVPLAVQSLRNAGSDPVGSLTGPAARGDLDTVEAHRAALAEHDLLDTLELYETLTAGAMRMVAGRVPSKEV